MNESNAAPIVRRGYADTALGQLHYAEAGEGQPILLLHQTPRSQDEFRDLLPLLAGTHRAIAMDMIGFGQSARLPSPQTIELFAQGAVALLDSLGLDKAAVVGHHTGGAVALEVAASAPSRVPALVLSSTPWTGPAFRAAHATPRVDVAESVGDGSHLMKLWSLRRPFYPDDRADLLERFLHDALSPGVDPAEGHRACARYVMEDSVARVKASTLLLGADADPFAFPSLEVLRRELINARSVDVAIIAEGGVALMEQSPQEVARHILDFLGPPVRWGSD